MSNGLPSGIPVLDALAGRNHGRPPLWLMRQAGRTLQSYRVLRAGSDFLAFCKDVRRAAEATLLPVRELGVDAAILFADITLPLEALGRTIEFREHEGPIIHAPVPDGRAAAALRVRDVGDRCGYVGEIVRAVRAALPAGVALIGFAPSPWTLAAYLVEGRARRGFPALKTFVYSDPPGFAALLETLTDLLIAYAEVQLAAGVQAFQVFDTWAELASPPAFANTIAPCATRQLAAIRGVPRIYFAKGTCAFLDAVAALPAEAIGCDWTVELAAVRRRLGPQRALQGNLDPGVLFAAPAAIRRETFRMLDAMTGDRAYVANLGHGLHPDIPEEHVRAFVKAVRDWEPGV